MKKQILKSVEFNFDDFLSAPEFYRNFSEKFHLSSEFGNNLDALWDVIVSGEIRLPIKIILRNTEKNTWKKAIRAVFVQAEQELNGELKVELFLSEK